MGSWLTLQRTIVICGPEGVGKTTLLNMLRKLDVPSAPSAPPAPTTPSAPALSGVTVPTMGFDHAKALYGHVWLDVYDIAGADAMQCVRDMLITESHGVVFIVSDLHPGHAYMMLEELDRSMPRGLPVLVFINKQDLKTSYDPQLLRARMARWERPWRVYGAVISMAKGIQPGLDWLIPML
jgi:signal recognition particle receptor subunit beta